MMSELYCVDTSFMTSRRNGRIVIESSIYILYVCSLFVFFLRGNCGCPSGIFRSKDIDFTVSETDYTVVVHQFVTFIQIFTEY